jgi:hypothetical protein
MQVIQNDKEFSDILMKVQPEKWGIIFTSKYLNPVEKTRTLVFTTTAKILETEGHPCIWYLADTTNVPELVKAYNITEKPLMLLISKNSNYKFIVGDYSVIQLKRQIKLFYNPAE